MEWRMENGEWRMENGEWRMKAYRIVDVTDSGWLGWRGDVV
jgi:hypothetical protein